MAQLLVRRIPEKVMNDLKRMARNDGTSVEELARRTLAATVEQRQQWKDFAAWSETFRRGQKRLPRDITTPLIRKDRAR